MKIIAGSLKGMKLLAPKDSLTTRPTSAKVREAILHKLEEDLQGSIFIDFFSGTGAIGLEALSRGARGSMFVEKDFSVVRLLKKNMALASERLEKQGFHPKPFKVFSAPAMKAFSSLKLSSYEGEPMILWADPPYKDFPLWWKFLKTEVERFPLSLDLIVMEIGADYLKKEDFELQSWEKDFEKVYGSTAVVGFRRTV